MKGIVKTYASTNTLKKYNAMRPDGPLEILGGFNEQIMITSQIKQTLTFQWGVEGCEEFQERMQGRPWRSTEAEL